MIFLQSSVIRTCSSERLAASACSLFSALPHTPLPRWIDWDWEQGPAACTRRGRRLGDSNLGWCGCDSRGTQGWNQASNWKGRGRGDNHDCRWDGFSAGAHRPDGTAGALWWVWKVPSCVKNKRQSLCLCRWILDVSSPRWRIWRNESGLAVMQPVTERRQLDLIRMRHVIRFFPFQDHYYFVSTILLVMHNKCMHWNYET